MEPMWSGSSPKKGANDFVVIADNSQRFAVKGENGERVGEELASLLKPRSQNRDPEFLEQIARTFRLRTYKLDRVLRRVGDYEKLDFSSTGSGMITALSRLQDRFDGRPLAGVLVFTDGNVADRKLIEVFENRDGGAPVYPVIIEGGEALQDLSLTGVEVTQSVFEDAPVMMVAEVSAHGLEGKGVVVRVKDLDGKVVATEGPATWIEDKRIDPAESSIFKSWRIVLLR